MVHKTTITLTILLLAILVMYCSSRAAERNQLSDYARNLLRRKLLEKLDDEDEYEVTLDARRGGRGSSSVGNLKTRAKKVSQDGKGGLGGGNQGGPVATGTPCKNNKGGCNPIGSSGNGEGSKGTDPGSGLGGPLQAPTLVSNADDADDAEDAAEDAAEAAEDAAEDAADAAEDAAEDAADAAEEAADDRDD